VPTELRLAPLFGASLFVQSPNKFLALPKITEQNCSIFFICVNPNSSKGLPDCPVTLIKYRTSVSTRSAGLLNNLAFIDMTKVLDEATQTQGKSYAKKQGRKREDDDRSRGGRSR